MRKRIIISGILMATLSPMAVYAQEEDVEIELIEEATDEVVQEEVLEEVVVEEQNNVTTGWVQVGADWYYYDANGNMIKGQMYQINGSMYLFGETGEMYKGFYYYNSTDRTYFQSNGKQASGWCLINNEWHYFNPSNNNIEYRDVKVEINGSVYYFQMNGAMTTGFYEQGWDTYYYDEHGVQAFGWKQINGSWYYFDKNNGAMYTDYNLINGQYYYFDETGKMFTGWMDDGGILYFQSNGTKAFGWLLIDGNWYYFDNSTGYMATGFYDIGGKTYYFGDDGIMRAGWYHYTNNGEDKWYYFDSHGVMQTGWQTINGKTYYFKEDGSMEVGRKLVDGNECFFDDHGVYLPGDGWKHIGDRWCYVKDGKSVKGEQVINGNTYRFSEFSYMCTGYYSTDDKLQYYGSNGILVKGWFEDKNGWHYCDQDGYLAKGWKTINGKKYYFDKDYFGVMLKGAHYIESPTGAVKAIFIFDDHGVLIENGWISQESGNTTYWYYAENGYTVTGWKTINGKEYYFNPDDGGIMATGEQYVRGKDGIKNYYHFDSHGVYIEKGWCEVYDGSYKKNYWIYLENGQPVKGWKTINGNKYYFASGNGYMVTGLYQIDSDTYYFASNGTICTGWQQIKDDKGVNGWFYFGMDGKAYTGLSTINNALYYFDTNTCVMQKGLKTVGGKTYFFADNGKAINTWYEKDGTWYYAYEDYTLASGFTTINGKNYVFELGRMLKGKVNVKETYYYADEHGVVVENGWINYNSYKCYAKDYVLVFGWQTIDGKTYYFNSVRNAVQGSHYIDGKRYIFDDDCVLATNGWVSFSNSGKSWAYIVDGEPVTGWKTINGKQYYFSSNGIMVNNVYDIDGKKYFFDNGVLVQNGWAQSKEYAGTYWVYVADSHPVQGWQTIDGKQYYFDAYCHMAVGSVQVYQEGKYYLFDEHGIKITSDGWHQVNGKWFYMENSDLVHGFKEINGIRYHFSIYNGQMDTGYFYYDGKMYYYLENGKPASGWIKTIDEDDRTIWQYAYSDGHLATGFVEIDGAYYLFMDGGVMATGHQRVWDGNKHYFLADNGKALTGWNQDKEGYWYYAGNDYLCVTGWQTINGKKYYFKTDSARMVTGKQIIDGTEYTFDESGALIS